MKLLMICEQKQIISFRGDVLYFIRKIVGNISIEINDV